MTQFSDYAVYVDESGDHGLSQIDPEFPVFVLAFCVFRKSDYVEQIVPRLQRLKFRFFGHDMIALHEREIRKSQGPFNILLDAIVRAPFFDELNGLMADSPFKLIASCIRKPEFRERRGDGTNPYHVALESGLERVFYQLQSCGQAGQRTHVVLERRGAREDDELELEFRRILDQTRVEGMAQSLEIVFASKQVNSAGLQFADLVARPIGRYLLRRNQPNRAFDILKTKFRTDDQGRIEGWGLKCYP